MALVTIVTREMQIKITFYTLEDYNKKDNNKLWQECRELEPSYTASRSLKWCNHFEKQPAILKILSIELSNNSAILL